MSITKAEFVLLTTDKINQILPEFKLYNMVLLIKNENLWIAMHSYIGESEYIHETESSNCSLELYPSTIWKKNQSGREKTQLQKCLFLILLTKPWFNRYPWIGRQFFSFWDPGCLLFVMFYHRFLGFPNALLNVAS